MMLVLYIMDYYFYCTVIKDFKFLVFLGNEVLLNAV